MFFLDKPIETSIIIKWQADSLVISSADANSDINTDQERALLANIFEHNSSFHEELILRQNLLDDDKIKIGFNDISQAMQDLIHCIYESK